MKYFVIIPVVLLLPACDLIAPYTDSYQQGYENAQGFSTSGERAKAKRCGYELSVTSRDEYFRYKGCMAYIEEHNAEAGLRKGRSGSTNEDNRQYKRGFALALRLGVNDTQSCQNYSDSDAFIAGCEQGVLNPEYLIETHDEADEVYGEETYVDEGWDD